MRCNTGRAARALTAREADRKGPPRIRLCAGLVAIALLAGCATRTAPPPLPATLRYPEFIYPALPAAYSNADAAAQIPAQRQGVPQPQVWVVLQQFHQPQNFAVLGLVPEFRRLASLETHRKQRGAGRAVGEQHAFGVETVGKRIGLRGHGGFLINRVIQSYKDVFM